MLSLKNSATSIQFELSFGKRPRSLRIPDLKDAFYKIVEWALYTSRTWPTNSPRGWGGAIFFKANFCFGFDLTFSFSIVILALNKNFFPTDFIGSLRVNLPPHHVVGNNALVYGGKEVLQVLHEFWNLNIDNLILIHNDILETNKHHLKQAICTYNTGQFGFQTHLNLCVCI